MIKGLLYISAVGLFLLSGCGSKNKIACSDENGLLALKNVVTEATEKQLRSENSNLTLSSIRATIAKIGMSFEDIRTSKNDPNLTAIKFFVKVSSRLAYLLTFLAIYRLH